MIKFAIQCGLVMFTCCSHTTLIAQNGTSTSTGSATDVAGTVEYSIGQIAYISGSGTSGTESQGTQQPYEIYILGNTEEKFIGYQCSVFPNPTGDLINLKISEAGFSLSSTIVLYNEMGTVLFERRIDTIDTSIDMRKLPEAVYLLKIMDEKKILHTFKIIKNR